MTIEIAVVADRSYLPWAATLIRSCLAHHEPESVRFHFLQDGSAPAEETARLTRMVAESGGTIDAHIVDDPGLRSLPTVEQFGSIIWLRLALPEILDIPRVLYLDADTLVVARLDELWSTPLDGAPLAAVPNVLEPDVRAHVLGLGLVPSEFFNSGVLLLDLELMRRERSLEILQTFARRHEGLQWPDQDTLNSVFAGRWRPLHPRWNAMNSLWVWRRWAVETFGAAAVREATQSPAVLHFEGPSLSKPWHYLSPHPWRSVYRRHLAATPWADTPLEDKTAATRLIRVLPASARLPVYRRLLARRGSP